MKTMCLCGMWQTFFYYVQFERFLEKRVSNCDGRELILFTYLEALEIGIVLTVGAEKTDARCACIELLIQKAGSIFSSQRDISR